MILFLTSSHTQNWIHQLNPANGFVDNLKACLSQPLKCVMISSFPDDIKITDRMAWEVRESFEWADMPFAHFEVLDRRTRRYARRMIRQANFIVLCGGHVPTENRFFQQLHLRELLEGFDGVIMSISAGSMNCANRVYAPPELEGEAADENYRQYYHGLGFTRINILPHFHKLKNMRIDGYHLINDLVMPQSFSHPVFGLPDGSYFVIDDEGTTLFGEAFKISRGKMRRICHNGEARRMSPKGWFYKI